MKISSFSFTVTVACILAVVACTGQQKDAPKNTVTVKGGNTDTPVAITPSAIATPETPLQVVQIEGEQEVEEAVGDVMLGYGTSDYVGRLILTHLPSECSVIPDSLVPGCVLLGGELPITCGKYGDFCLAVGMADKRPRQTAKFAMMETMLKIQYDRRMRYRESWGSVYEMVTGPICDDIGCFYATAEGCPWMTERTTECICTGKTSVMIVPTPDDPELEGMTFIAIITGTWTIRYNEKGEELFEDLFFSTKWDVKKDDPEDE